MTYEEIVTSLMKFKSKLRQYEEDLVEISVELILESTESWISNNKVSYEDKESELNFLLEYYHKKQNIEKWEYIRKIQKKLYESN